MPRIVLLLGAARGFDRGLLSGIARYAYLNGPWTFYREHHRYLNRASRLKLDELKTWKPDGAMCPIQSLELIRQLRVPTISLDINYYEGKVPGICSEDLKAGQLAGEHLLSLGLRQFAYCGIESMRWSEDRANGFCKTVAEAGYHTEVFQPRHRRPISWSKEEPSIRRWLQSLPKPIGLFCANDDRSANILECCRDHGYGVPEDVAVIGVDDDSYVCDLANPPLSSVTLGTERAGYEAAELLHRMILGKEKMSGQRIVAKATGVTARQSTDVLTARDVEVRAALQFIRENINQPIQVRDVVRATGVSHRTLNDRFYRQCGFSIMKYLTNARVTKISQLLRDTTLTISKISEMVGFDSGHHFARYFRRATGMTPQEYRRKHSAP